MATLIPDPPNGREAAPVPGDLAAHKKA
jgi:hypothetical protein